MALGINTYEEVFERKLALVRRLCNALSAAKAAIVSCKIEELEREIAEQFRLCGELQALDSNFFRLPVSDIQGDATQGRGRELLEQLQFATTEVKRLKGEQQALVNRSRRTVNALQNALRSFAGYYNAETVEQSPVAATVLERV
jgi:hypothetical protein